MTRLAYDRETAQMSIVGTSAQQRFDATSPEHFTSGRKMRRETMFSDADFVCVVRVFVSKNVKRFRAQMTLVPG